MSRTPQQKVWHWQRRFSSSSISTLSFQVKAGVEQGQPIEDIGCVANRSRTEASGHEEINTAESSWTRLLLTRQLWLTLESVQTALICKRNSKVEDTYRLLYHARFGRLNRGCYGFFAVETAWGMTSYPGAACCLLLRIYPSYGPPTAHGNSWRRL